MMLLTNRNVTGLATKKKMSAEMKENFTFRAVERDIVRMWVIFRDPKNAFNHVDKFVVEVVEDKDIVAYQQMLLRVLGGRLVDFHLNVPYNQQIFTSLQGAVYFAKKYTSWVDDNDSSPQEDSRVQAPMDWEVRARRCSE
jgi:hypothetical protein